MSSQSQNKAQPQPKKKTGPSALVKGYLVLYNVASTAAWANVLYQTILYLRQSPSTFESVTTSAPSWLPSSIAPYFKHATSTYGAVGELTKWVQTGAALEVLHSLLGFVRSPVQTTAMQVASRLYLVWGIADRFASAQSSPYFATMVLSWSITECIRYPFYALGLVGSEPGFLLWLRYTTFYILYPTGAGSEALVCLATLPFNKPITEWDAWSLARGGLVLFWAPALYVMYMHMVAQRRKIFGSGAKKTKTKTA
ncbi:PTPLA-domain-containing protein [Peniophora sp. CONT]|nr:PTPLA-domain-containing protein [Peniophora sp. CONT]